MLKLIAKKFAQGKVNPATICDEASDTSHLTSGKYV